MSTYSEAVLEQVAAHLKALNALEGLSGDMYITGGEVWLEMNDAPCGAIVWDSNAEAFFWDSTAVQS